MTQVRKHRAPAPQRVPATPRQAAACAGPLDDLLNPDLFAALADPTRVALVACIAKCGRGCSVGEVAECCSVDLSVVSRHLALLARAGVLEAARDGRTVRYRVRYDSLATTLRSLADALDDCHPPTRSKAACCDVPCSSSVESSRSASKPAAIADARRASKVSLLTKRTHTK